MVANAGIMRQQSITEGILNLAFLFTSISIVLLVNIGEWESVWAVNICGVVLCYKYAIIQMSKQSSGSHILSMWMGSHIALKDINSFIFIQGCADYRAYCASKAAVQSLTQTACML